MGNQKIGQIFPEMGKLISTDCQRMSGVSGRRRRQGRGRPAPRGVRLELGAAMAIPLEGLPGPSNSRSPSDFGCGLDPVLNGHRDRIERRAGFELQHQRLAFAAL